MDLNRHPRHRRSQFSCRLVSVRTPAETEDELLDFTPPGDEDAEAEQALELLSMLSRSIMEPHKAEPAAADDDQEAQRIKNVLARLAAAVKDRSDVDLEHASWFEQPARSRMRVKIKVLPSGQRIETYNNGSKVVKDTLGRVIEVKSRFGDCLLFEYGSFGRLESFSRLDRHGLCHSTGRHDRHGVTVRDAEGRVRAAGESMTVDPWGCFYLHSLNGQYFCLDLVAGIHSERRRITRMDGSTDYVTAAFAHDGFRMATMYSFWGAQSFSPARTAVYRFYGRDGTVIEFNSEEDLRRHCPSRAFCPGSKPPDSSWLKKPQANTAWESVFEYLCRIS